jgi:hypothetical protein
MPASSAHSSFPCCCSSCCRPGDGTSRFLFAWCAFVVGYVVAGAWRLVYGGPDHIRENASKLDDSAPIILLLSLAAAVASFIAVFGELNGVNAMPDGVRHFHLALTAATIVVSWLFVQAPCLGSMCSRRDLGDPPQARRGGPAGQYPSRPGAARPGSSVPGDVRARRRPASLRGSAQGVFAGDESRLAEMTEGWPEDIRPHTRRMAADAFARGARGAVNPTGSRV